MGYIQGSNRGIYFNHDVRQTDRQPTNKGDKHVASSRSYCAVSASYRTRVVSMVCTRTITCEYRKPHASYSGTLMANKEYLNLYCSGRLGCRRNCSGLRNERTGAPLCTTCWIAEYQLNEKGRGKCLLEQN